MQAQINPCENGGPFHIVVLGSSTAAGAGASSSDSAWVNRYRNHLKTLNPGNTVTNLAQGGYNTYKLMPNGFVPPIGRPAIDTLKNITRALSLNPDGIIVNLPSNDVASGFSLAEQIFNMDSIFQTAQHAGIPIWICTTQPRNFSVSQMQAQADMRDSIIDHYSPFVLDFWTGLALPNNSLDPFFDSGDGVHLNDKGHALIFTRAIDKKLTLFFFEPALTTDIKLLNINNLNYSVCGNSSNQFSFITTNLGTQDSLGYQVYFQVKQNAQVLYFDSVFFGSGLNTCAIDSASFYWNSTVAGNYQIGVWTSHLGDTIQMNDSLYFDLKSIGRPSIFTRGDSLCEIGLAELVSLADPQDSVLWYKSPFSSQVIAGGSLLQIPMLQMDTVFYAQAVRGELFYKKSLNTTENSNINWNGTMFDLVANDSLVIDSLSSKFFDQGLKILEVYSKSGSYRGFEQNASVWTLIKQDSINVINAGEFLVVHIPSISMSQGDTIGIYLQLQDPSARLSYQSVSNPVIRSNPELSIITGSGIGHNFGAIFYPRDWNGKIHYHHGYRPEGDCATNRIAVKVEYSDQILYLGQDSSLLIGDSIILTVPAGFYNPKWEDGSTDTIRVIRGLDLGLGTHQIALSAQDSLKCIKKDSLQITFGAVSIENMALNQKIKVFPNPARDRIYIEGEIVFESYKIIDLQGKPIESGKIIGNSIEITNIRARSYILEISNRNQTIHKKIVLTHKD